MNTTKLSAPGNSKDQTVFASYWSSICATYPPGLLELVLLVATQLIFFWFPSALLLFLDLTFPAFSNRHKIQSERRQPTWPQIKHCIHHVAKNNITSTIIHLVISYFLGFQPLFRVDLELPSGWKILEDFVFAIATREVLFYYTHRLLHHQQIYKYIHKYLHLSSLPPFQTLMVSR